MNFMNQLIKLINESKRTDCKLVANYTWSVLFHYAISNPDYLILIESDGVNKRGDLILIKDGKWGACIPVTKLKPDVLGFCYNSIGKKYFSYVTRKRQLITVKRRIHKRDVKPCLPGQTEYLMSKLSDLCPHWFHIAKRYLINV
jgi:hypothetical protein